MIHFITEGAVVRMGLNLHAAPYGFVAIWAWYDAYTREVSHRRLRIRLHQRPFVLWSVQRVNVISGYLRSHNLELVDRETLHDLQSTEAANKRTNERLAYLKTQ